MKAWLLALGLLTGACQPQDTADKRLLQPPNPSPAQSVPALVASLAGEWRVAGVDGRAFDEPAGIALSADAEEIWWAPRCAGMIRTYLIQGNAFSTGPHKGFVPRKPGEPTPPVCAIGLPARFHEVVRAIDAATMIRRTANNGIELSGGGRSLLLFSQ